MRLTATECDTIQHRIRLWRAYVDWESPNATPPPWGFASRGERAVKFVLVLRGSGILTSQRHSELIPLRGGDVFIMLDDELIDCSIMKIRK